MIASLQTLVSFDGDDGRDPSTGVTADSQGNLFGVTAAGGQYDQGTVFELPNVFGSYGSDPTTLVSFYGGNGSVPNANLIIDLDGSLFGETAYGPGDGTVYQIINHTGYYGDADTLVAFDGTDGQVPVGGLIMDGDRNLFGTTSVGGTSDEGTIFEIPYLNGSYASSPVTLFSFGGSGEGKEPIGGLIMDKDGDLFGTTSDGGASNDGTVFELTDDFGTYASTPTTLVSFSGADGAHPEAGLIMDDQGDLFGTTSAGGSAGDGTVFEIAADTDGYADSPTTLVSFSGGNGAQPYSPLVIDAKGDLFGTTSAGGSANDGTVFKIADKDGNYADAPTTLVNFSGANGAHPYGGLFPDSQGELFGTTQSGGDNSDGTVFEVTDAGFQVACYCSGTMILTSKGQMRVEALVVGDVIVTASGGHQPVRWVGRRHLDITRHPDPRAVWPVRVSAGTFAENVPSRDLWMSPGHNVFVGGVLMPVRVLVNGVTVAQVPMDEVTYWHVELDRHDVILAEGLPAESYLDTGNRSAFENGGGVLDLNPDFEPRHQADHCAPIRKAGPEVEAARASLLARAAALGHVASGDPDLHVLADQTRIEAIKLTARRFVFALPANCTTVSLTSRTFVPSHVDAKRTDGRVLGVCIKRLEIDGRDVDLRGDLPTAVWHAPEEKPSHIQRWTKETIPLPAGTRLILVDLAGEGRYWVEPRGNVVLLRA